MLEFKIKINNGAEISINEPIGFDGVDFNLTRSKELYGVSSSFAGNSIDFEFVKEKHDNVFDDIMTQYESKGFNANVVINIYYNSTLLFDGNFDFATAQTDGVNYLKVQVVKKDKLYYLDKNKGISVDLFSDEDLDKETSTIAPSTSIALPPVTLVQESIWEDKINRGYQATSIANTTSVFNNIKTQTKDELSDSLNWLDNYNTLTATNAKNFQLISAKDNLTNVTVWLDIQGYFANSDVFDSTAVLKLCYGKEYEGQPDTTWYSNLTTIDIATININGTTNANVFIQQDTSIGNIPRGSGVWVYWEITKTLASGLTAFFNTSSSLKVTANSKSYYSYLNCVKYKDLVSNAIKKVAKINNVVWNLDFYKDTFALNGNLLRHINNKPFNIKWEDIVKQFGERNLGCYYNEVNDTLYIDHRSNILGRNKIIELGDLAKKDVYSISEDSEFIINKFSFKYSKYQALKDDAVNGNYSSVHGDSEWYVANKGYEGTISVDLPYLRDSFMIEDIRIKSVKYKDDTSTNEDDTIILIEGSLNSPKQWATETLVVQSSYDSTSTELTFRNDSDFSWLRIGVKETSPVKINGVDYTVSSVDNTQVILLPTTPNILNLTGVQIVNFQYRLESAYIGKLTNGLLNQDFSLRQNINYWKETLSTTSYYHKTPIINTVYKENKNAVINGLSEIADINILNPINKPRLIETTVVITVSEYNTLKNNRVGYVTIKDAKDNDLDIYITDLQATFLNGCDQMKATIKGWVKSDNDNDYFFISKNNINGFYYNNLVFYFDDINESVTITENGTELLYSNLKAPYICRPYPLSCFINYLGAKNYLLSL